MDSSLTSAIGVITRGATAGEATSRCARCVKDKKGCDRRYPCSRCLEIGTQDSCTYTGAIQSTRRRATPLKRKRVGRPSLADTEVDELTLDFDEDIGTTPSTVRRRRRGKGVRSERSNSNQKPYVSVAQQPVPDKDWYRQPPAKPEDITELDPEPEKSEAELSRQKVLSAYTDIVTHLPIELYRSTTFINALQRSYRTKTQQLDELCLQLQKSTNITQAIGYRQKIVMLMAESRQDRAEAVAEATKLTQLIASHITLLSNDLDKLENPQSKIALVNQEASGNTDEPLKSTKKNSKGTHQETSTDLQLDDDEPTYCICHRVSFGQMVACENTDCQHGEWFHFDCLNLTSPPRGKWWCPECTNQGFASKRFTEEVAANTSGKGGGRKLGETREEKRKRIKLEIRRREAERREKLRRSRR